jgi:exopolysaccharide biosynthesis polyprenyl glycosylphosphotransferase
MIRSGRLHVASEQLFRQLVAAERRCADRRDTPCAVLTLDASRVVDWAEAIAALRESTRDADVIGWLETGAVLGAILHGVTAADRAHLQHVEERLQAALTQRMGNAASRFSIRLHVQPTVKPAATYSAIKRTFDIAISATLLILLAPLFLLIAAIVKFRSPGPVLYRQMRIGQMMKPFPMLKFRTMYVNAEAGLHKEFVSKFITSSRDLQASCGSLFKIRNDPRVTPVGRVLRKTSLDELPQLWNVLRGDMSLVGPRPPLPYEVEQYKRWHTRRVIDVKPGITGLWQVRGRSRTTFEEMVRLDLQYARTCSLWTDIKILLATPGAVFWGDGAC